MTSWGGSPHPHCDCGHRIEDHAGGNLGARSAKFPGGCSRATPGGGWCVCHSYNPETEPRPFTRAYFAIAAAPVTAALTEHVRAVTGRDDLRVVLDP